MDLSSLARAGAAEPPPPEVFTAQVVRADESGLWVVPLGEDPRHPVGPCRGGYTGNGTLVPPGRMVMLAQTPDGPWVVGLDDPALVITDPPVAVPAAEHQDYLRRATLTLAGGGHRLVTAGGNASWSQPFTIAGAGMEADEALAGRFEIAMPTAGIVIPVHSSAARTSYTVAGGVIALNADDALWYELPLGAVATSQPGRFHIIESTSADGFAPAPHWVLVVRRGNWSSSNHAPEYRWGDGRAHDPWRTPALNAGWVEGTVLPRFAKQPNGDVRMKGRVRTGTGSAFTLPVGYTPGGTHCAIVRDGAGAAGLLTVTSGGVVTTGGSNTDHSIETTFPAEL